MQSPRFSSNDSRIAILETGLITSLVPSPRTLTGMWGKNKKPEGELAQSFFLSCVKPETYGKQRLAWRKQRLAWWRGTEGETGCLLLLGVTAFLLPEARCREGAARNRQGGWRMRSPDLGLSAVPGVRFTFLSRECLAVSATVTNRLRRPWASWGNQSPWSRWLEVAPQERLIFLGSKILHLGSQAHIRKPRRPLVSLRETRWWVRGRGAVVFDIIIALHPHTPGALSPVPTQWTAYHSVQIQPPPKLCDLGPQKLEELLLGRWPHGFTVVSLRSWGADSSSVPSVLRDFQCYVSLVDLVEDEHCVSADYLFGNESSLDPFLVEVYSGLLLEGAWTVEVSIPQP